MEVLLWDVDVRASNREINVVVFVGRGVFDSVDYKIVDFVLLDVEFTGGLV
jgi:hypothetical protein